MIQVEIEGEIAHAASAHAAAAAAAPRKLTKSGRAAKGEGCVCGRGWCMRSCAQQWKLRLAPHDGSIHGRVCEVVCGCDAVSLEAWSGR